MTGTPVAIALALGCMLSCSTAPRKTVHAEHPERLDFNGTRASWRVFTDDSICEAEPRFLRDELLSVNELLKRFVARAEADDKAPWPAADVALIAEAQRVLPEVISQHAENLAQVQRCAFRETAGYPSVIERGLAFVAQSKALLESAPQVIARVKARRAYAVWDASRLASQESARRLCPTKATRQPVLYFAFRDESQRTSWLFCDGVAVLKTADHEPEVEMPPAELGRRTRRAADYLRLASEYPKSTIVAPP